jgi:hypothetical protein
MSIRFSWRPWLVYNVAKLGSNTPHLARNQVAGVAESDRTGYEAGRMLRTIDI